MCQPNIYKNKESWHCSTYFILLNLDSRWKFYKIPFIFLTSHFPVYRMANFIKGEPERNITMNRTIIVRQEPNFRFFVAISTLLGVWTLLVPRIILHMGRCKIHCKQFSIYVFPKKIQPRLTSYVNYTYFQNRTIMSSLWNNDILQRSREVQNKMQPFSCRYKEKHISKFQYLYRIFIFTDYS